jgi:hypothetical protein
MHRVILLVLLNPNLHVQGTSFFLATKNIIDQGLWIREESRRFGGEKINLNTLLHCET